MDVKINVIGQKLSFHSNATIVSGSKNFVKFIFSFTNDWNLLIKYAQFIQGDNSYVVEIGDDNYCFVPQQIEDGECNLNVYGVGGDGGAIIATTNTLMFNVFKSDYINDGSSVIINDDYIASVDEVENFISGINSSTNQYSTASEQEVSDYINSQGG